MTPDQFLAGIRVDHVLAGCGVHCRACAEKWPCPTELLARAVEAVDRALWGKANSSPDSAGWNAAILHVHTALSASLAQNLSQWSYPFPIAKEGGGE